MRLPAPIERALGYGRPQRRLVDPRARDWVTLTVGTGTVLPPPKRAAPPGKQEPPREDDWP
jgi:hypothetical protein